MGALIYFTSLIGEWSCFDPGQAELMLPPTGSHPERLYRLSTTCPHCRWISGTPDEEGHLVYEGVSETMVAMAYAHRGLESPEGLAYLLTPYEMPRPWLAPGSKKWQGVEEVSLGEVLNQTPDFRFVMVYPGRPRDQNRVEGVTSFLAMNWLDYNGYHTDANAVSKEHDARAAIPLSVIPDQHSLLLPITLPDRTPSILEKSPSCPAVTPNTPATLEESPTTAESATESVETLSPCHRKAYESHKWAVEQIGKVKVTPTVRSYSAVVLGIRVRPFHISQVVAPRVRVGVSALRSTATTASTSAR
jgi:hypothetical protein